MNMGRQLAKELGIKPTLADQIIELLDKDNTIPFIARYRKEATGEMNEVELRAFADRLAALRRLEQRKAEIIRLLSEQGVLTAPIQEQVQQAAEVQVLEDIYRPFRPKRRTRASVAIEKGLTPLADQVWAQKSSPNPEALSKSFVQNEVTDWEAAKQGALDILAERVADHAAVRRIARSIGEKTGVIHSRNGNNQNPDFQMYFDYQEPLGKVPPHRVLAMNRGERQEALNIRLRFDDEQIIRRIKRLLVTNPNSPCRAWIEAAVEDGCARLLIPSIERELRKQLTERAEQQAITVFAGNLKNLLLQPPVRGQVILGLDPAYRTGCKIAVIDQQGDVLATDTIYPHSPQNRWQESIHRLQQLQGQYGFSLIAIGNGTASRESEQLISELIAKVSPDQSLQYLVVNEAGASVYSASESAREEFPDLDVSIRGAISIARRLLDPLAELVKIDAKSIGVGQYQHDVHQKHLAKTLDGVVESCVNYVGAELNSASAELLQHVAGLSANTAKSIIQFRQQHKQLKNRRELLQVKGLGPKIFQQCAGFLRIANGDEHLDNTAVHPESYDVARKIIALQTTQRDLSADKLAEKLGAGVPTVRDILLALNKPGRDPRQDVPPPLFQSQILSIDDLAPGMILKGTVQNVVDFGVFVDIGVKQSGLIHISQLSERYVSHPMDVVQVGDILDVQVLSVDKEQGRIGLSRKKSPDRSS